MPHRTFAHVDAYVFDLDNTLYPKSVRLFDQIEIRMTDWVAEELGVTQPEANRLRRQYWQQYGTTLAGLMREHGVDPGPYLTDVHDIDFSELQEDRELASRIKDLPGKKIVYTNGCAPYAARVLEARGLMDVIDAVFGVEDADFAPKPERAAFERVFAKAGIKPRSGAMFEDDPRNLEVPFDMGMQTVLVDAPHGKEDHITHRVDGISDFLGQLLDGFAEKEAKL